MRLEIPVKIHGLQEVAAVRHGVADSPLVLQDILDLVVQHGGHVVDFIIGGHDALRVSFLRAFDYQEAIQDRKYYGETDILRPEYFAKELEIQQKMAEAGVASHLLLKVESENAESLTEKSRGLVRQSDYIGMDENGGLYLLLSMVTKDTFSVIGERLQNKGISYSIVEEE